MHKDVWFFFGSSQIFRKFSLKSKLHSFNLLDLLVGVYKTKSMQWGVSPNRVLIVNNNSLILNWFSKRSFVWWRHYYYNQQFPFFCVRPSRWKTLRHPLKSPTPAPSVHMKPPVTHSLRSKCFQSTYAVNPLLSPPSQISPLFSGEEG